jgi:ethylmalonyl-CoA mutase
MRDKPWIFRTYAGHSTAAESNALYRNNLGKGQTGLSVAFDLPTQTGYDSDHPLAKGEVGKVGVAISHLGDMRTLFADIPLGEMNTSMTINATAAWLLALYIAAADEQGVDRRALQGTTQNDIIKEYLSRGTYVFPPAPSMRLTKDVILYTTAELPKWNPMNVCSYHLQEAGATPVQELAFALATAIAVLDTVKASNEVDTEIFGNVVGRISFFVNAGLKFITELCKMRAFAELWDEITAERYGVTDPKHRLFRYGVQVNSLGLTEQQPENNVYRILLETLAVTLSKRARARAVQLPAWNEALGLPRPWDQQWSLRLQQVLAYETDLLDYGDIFDGSAAIAAKVVELKREAKAELARIDAMGGAVAAVETSYMKQKLVESNARRLEAIERGAQVVVGVNKFVDTEPSPLAAGTEAILTVPQQVETEQVERLKAWRQSRDARAAAAALDALRAAAQEGRNVMPASIECAKVGVTTGEWGAALREVFGEYRAPTGVSGAAAHPGEGLDRARRGRPRVPQTRPAYQVSGGQARARRPFQRRRTDRGARPRRRHGGRLRRHPAHPRRDRQRRARGGRARGGTIDSLRLARAARQRHRRAHAGSRARGRAGGGRRHHSAGRRAPAQGRRGRRRLHAEALRAHPHHGRHRPHRGHRRRQGRVKNYRGVRTGRGSIPS